MSRRMQGRIGSVALVVAVAAMVAACDLPADDGGDAPADFAQASGGAKGSSGSVGS